MSGHSSASETILLVFKAGFRRDALKRASLHRKEMMVGKLERVVDFYLLAKGTVVGEGFGEELEWQDQIRLSDVDESHFLREAAWVVLSSGMREAVIRGKFRDFSLAFHNWVSAGHIIANSRLCRRNASRIFCHSQKINSIIEIARSIEVGGFDAFKEKIESGGVAFLRSLPFIGPATCYHLAKNIGLDVVKPDRHLLRISALAGYASPGELCQLISSAVGDRLSVVDLVVWRYATLNPGYRAFLSRYLQ
jgi:hypothetical protein